VQTTVQHEDFDPRLRRNADEALLVKFEVRPLLNKEASDKEGRPIYKDVEYISIRAPGSPDEVCRPASPRDIDRFPRHYQAFKNRIGNEDIIEGTLLSEWPMISRSHVEELSFMGVKTVEQLAGMSDANGQRIMGFHGLKKKAAEWIEIANAGVSAAELKKELEQRDQELAELRALVAELKPKRGRKPKVAEKTQEE